MSTHPPRTSVRLKRNKSALKKYYRCVDHHSGRHLPKNTRQRRRNDARLAVDLTDLGGES